MSSIAVYLVDGDPAVRDSLSTLLDLNGFPVNAYETGEAFLSGLARGVADGEPCCIVCEAELPDTSGIDLFEHLKARHQSEHFALLVSRRDQTVVRSARSAGIDRIFMKPLVHRKLIEFVGTEAAAS